jgi:hypothetical protein
MFVLACLKHWYTSLIFFGPIPIIGFWVWLSGRRQGRREEGDERFVERDGHVPV